jgi:hypothetical protein
MAWERPLVMRLRRMKLGFAIFSIGETSEMSAPQRTMSSANLSCSGG